MIKAKFIQEITIIDPVSELPVEVSIYKNLENGGLFGIDSSYIDQVLNSELNLIIPDIFDDTLLCNVELTD